MSHGKIVGILGGMGPAATSELFEKIINNTKATIDQEHVSTIIINDPMIPDRTEYILGKGTSPIPRLVKNIKKLSEIGADVIVIPCMTAHTFISELQSYSPVPIINAIHLAENHLKTDYQNIEKIGLLATDGSIKSGVFKKYISKEIYVPESKNQRALIEIIYGEHGIKAGNTSANQIHGVKKIVDDMKKYNIQAVVAGCTELSMIMNEKNMSIPIIDPLILLAKHVVEIGFNKQYSTL